MPIVYGFKPSPFVRKVRVALAEKGIAHEFEPAAPLNPYGLGPFPVSEEFLKISPLGKIPAYRDGDVALADSSIICAYLERVRPEPPLYPDDPYEYARALWFEEYGDTALADAMTGKVSAQMLLAPRLRSDPPDVAAIQRAFSQGLPPIFDYLEGQLDGGGTIAGSRFSIGDIGVATHFVNLRYAGFDVDAARWPKLASYIDSVLSRPSFKVVTDDELATLEASLSQIPGAASA